MENVPISFLLLYGLPESLILISLSSALYGYDVLNNLKKLCLFSIFSILTIYLVRSMPVKFGFHILIQIPVFALLITYILKLSWRRSLVIVVTSFVISILGEIIYYSVVLKAFNVDIGQAFSDQWVRLRISWIYLLVLLGITALVVKKQFSFTNALHLFKKSSINTKISLMVVVVLLQALLAGLLQMASIYERFSVFPIAITNNTLQTAIGVALITIPIVSIFLLKRLFALSQQEAISATQEAFIDNINSLFVTVRGQRHDFIHHVQVIYSLLKSGQEEDAVSYMDNLLDDIQEVNEVIKVKHPALSALLNTKIAVAERHKIYFETNIATSIEDINIKSLDLVKILGNLLDNAIEAVTGESPEYRKVAVSITRFNNAYVFEVTNLRPIIPPDELQAIFTGGFTTKKENGHSGIGLAVVKEIVQKYKGEIGVRSKAEEGTTFTVIIPN